MVSKEMNQSIEKESEFFYGYFIVGASILMISIMWGTYFSFGVFLKPMLDEFGWNRATTSGASSLASMINGILAIAMGQLTDRVGPRTVLTVCGLLLSLGLFMMSQMSAVWHLYLFYGVLVGSGMSGSFIPLLSTVARWFFKRRGMMTGIVAAGTGIGALIGPPGTTRLISIYGWRLSYVVLGGVALSVVVLSAQFMKRDPMQVGQHAYGANRVEEGQLHSGDDGFSLREAVYTNRFWLFFSTGFCYGFCVFAIMVHIVPHAIELGISAIRAANILATVGGAAILGKVSLGRAGISSEADGL